MRSSDSMHTSSWVDDEAEEGLSPPSLPFSFGDVVLNLDRISYADYDS